MLTVTASVEGKISEAFALQRQGNALDGQLKLLREKWDHELDPEPRLQAMRPLEQKLRERVAVLTEQHDKLVDRAGALSGRKLQRDDEEAWECVLGFSQLGAREKRKNQHRWPFQKISRANRGTRFRSGLA